MKLTPDRRPQDDQISNASVDWLGRGKVQRRGQLTRAWQTLKQLQILFGVFFHWKAKSCSLVNFINSLRAAFYY